MNSKLEKAFNLDETPNLRSLIVNTEEHPNKFENFTVDILKDTIRTLTDYLTKELCLKPPQRMKNLADQKLYTKEEENKLLCDYESFKEGGARI